MLTASLVKAGFTCVRETHHIAAYLIKVRTEPTVGPERTLTCEIHGKWKRHYIKPPLCLTLHKLCVGDSERSDTSECGLVMLVLTGFRQSKNS